MEPIGGILFEPVGCLADFPVEPFQAIAAELGRQIKPTRSASRIYWHLLHSLQSASLQQRETIEALEQQAVSQSSLYEDVVPALSQLRAMGIQLLLASSLSDGAVERFIGANALAPFFTAVRGRTSAHGVQSAPLRGALEAAQITPEQVVFLTDTAEGMETARRAGVRSVLMMNDPDESKRLAQRNPAGGVISLIELPDFARFLLAQTARPT